MSEGGTSSSKENVGPNSKSLANKKDEEEREHRKKQEPEEIEAEKQPKAEAEHKKKEEKEEKVHKKESEKHESDKKKEKKKCEKKEKEEKTKKAKRWRMQQGKRRKWNQLELSIQKTLTVTIFNDILDNLNTGEADKKTTKAGAKAVILAANSVGPIKKKKMTTKETRTSDAAKHKANGKRDHGLGSLLKSDRYVSNYPTSWSRTQDSFLHV